MNHRRLEKLFRLLGSDQEAEALAALRFLKGLAVQERGSWNQFVDELVAMKFGHRPKVDQKRGDQAHNTAKQNSEIRRTKPTCGTRTRSSLQGKSQQVEDAKADEEPTRLQPLTAKRSRPLSSSRWPKGASQLRKNVP